MSRLTRFLGTYVPRTLYFLSAFSPLFIVFGIQAFYDGSFATGGIYSFTFLSSFSGVLFYLYDIREDDPIPITPKSVKSTDSDVYQFLIAYLIPFLGIDTNSTGEAVAFIFLLGTVGLAYIRTETPHINPILMIVGLHFYEIEVGSSNQKRSCGLISERKDIRPGKPILAQRRSQFVYVHQPKSNP